MVSGLDWSRVLSAPEDGQPVEIPDAQQAAQPDNTATTVRRAIGVPHAVADALPRPWSCRMGDSHRCWFVLYGERQAEILRDTMLTTPVRLFEQPAAAPSRPLVNDPLLEQSSRRQAVYDTVSARLWQLRMEASAAAEDDQPLPYADVVPPVPSLRGILYRMFRCND